MYSTQYSADFEAMVDEVNKACLAVLDSMNTANADYKRTETKEGFYDFALEVLYALHPHENGQSARRAAQIITHYYFS